MGVDLRRHASQTQRRLILGGLAVIIVVAEVLIYLFMGREAALLGLLCLAIGISPLALIWLALRSLEWLAARIGGEG